MKIIKENRYKEDSFTKDGKVHSDRYFINIEITTNDNKKISISELPDNIKEDLIRDIENGYEPKRSNYGASEDFEENQDKE